MPRIAVSIVILAIAGCGGSHAAYVDHSRDPLAYARDVKELVVDHVHLARQSREPGDMLVPIVSELDRLEDRPVGEYREVYEQLRAAAQQLLEACQRVDGRPPELQKQLDQLLELVAPLPGDVRLVHERR